MAKCEYFVREINGNHPPADRSREIRFCRVKGTSGLVCGGDTSSCPLPKKDIDRWLRFIRPLRKNY